MAGTDLPAPVRRGKIPKDAGGRRSVGMPTLFDRTIAQVLNSGSVILCPRQRAGELILWGVRRLLADKLELTINGAAGAGDRPRGSPPGELIGDGRFDDIEDARTASFESIEVDYNTQRKHSAHGHLTPNQFEEERNKLTQA